ncbi:MAG: hypothetical protein WAL41_10750 [Mycobacterium sp.]
MPNAGPPSQIPVGSLYGLPGFTETFEQFENINNFSTTLSNTAQTPFNPPASFQKTDIVKWWEMEMFFTYSNAATTDGLAWTPYAPYNLVQNFKLKLQGQYSPLEVESGIDLAYWQMIRPMRGKGQQSSNALAGQYAQGVAWPTIAPAANLYGSTYVGVAQPGVNPNPILTPFGSGSYPWSFFSPTWQSPFGALQPATGVAGTLAGTVPVNLELPAGIWLDQYWDLAVDGSLLPNASGVVQPVSAFVSPQYMGGGERVIVPQFNFSPLTVTQADQGPMFLGTGAVQSTVSASVITNCRRIGVYSSENPAELPPVYNWQYRRASKRYPIGAVTKVDIPVTEYGQLFSVFVRIVDPGGTPSGSPANLTGQSSGIPSITSGVPGYVNKCQLLYGSNLPKFDDDLYTMQQRHIYQHGVPPLNGMIAWDMLASGQDDLLTNNSRVLNTLTNANTHVHLEFSNSLGLSSSAYAVVGTELLVPVSTQ